MTANSNPTDSIVDFESEWSRANDLYNQGINAGYTPEDSAALYLAPVQTKWKTAANVPADSKKLKQFQSEWEPAINHYQEAIKGGYSADDAAQLYLNPVQNKWTIEGGLQKTEEKQNKPLTQAQENQYFRNSPVLQGEEVDARKQMESGMNPVDVLEAHPTLLNTPPYAGRWREVYSRALFQRDASARKAGEPPKPSGLETERSKNVNLLKDPSISSSAADYAHQRIAEIDSILGKVADKNYGQAPSTNSAPEDVTVPPMFGHTNQFNYSPPASTNTFKVGRFTVRTQ